MHGQRYISAIARAKRKDPAIEVVHVDPDVLYEMNAFAKGWSTNLAKEVEDLHVLGVRVRLMRRQPIDAKGRQSIMVFS